ncbi:hypothetical protein [Streptomyces sp. NPDC093111]|uniref:hypothetical protein n=1 Tax=Streptomyces sp. NPDC093111 TaxID=3154978 RepID=UPI00343FC005
MGESVQVRCPECLRTQRYAPPVFPCACGTPIAPPVIHGATARPVTHRNWSEEWVTVLCPTCAHPSDWPHPELGCACGAVLRVPVRGPGYAEGVEGVGAGGGARGADGSDGAGGEGGESGGLGGSGSGGADVGGVTDGRSADGRSADGRPVDGSASPGAHAPTLGAGSGSGSGSAHGSSPGSGSGSGTHDTPEAAHRPTTWSGAQAAQAPTPAPAPAPTPAPVPPPATPAHSPVSDADGYTHADADADADRDAYPTFTQRHPSPPHPALPGAQAAALPVRPAFRPVTIRTARDAVAASAGYLRWLGFRDVVQPEERSAVAVDLRGPGLVAQVDPSTRPTGLRAVECLWLNGLSNGATSVCFSLAGYTPEAHERAEGLGIPLFVLDLTGTPQPVNAPADTLVDTGAA